MHRLRDRLRADTHLAHRQVDQTYSALNLTTPRGLRVYLRANYIATASLCGWLHPQSILVDRRCELLERDLRHLGSRPPQSTVTAPHAHVNSLGYSYTVAGSHAGARVLRRHWARTSDKRIRGAGRYLCDDSTVAIWTSIRHELESMPAYGDRQDEIVYGALSCFSVYLEAYSLAAYVEDASHASPTGK